jgi:hypothetical protein
MLLARSQPELDYAAFSLLGGGALGRLQLLQDVLCSHAAAADRKAE